MPDFGNSEVVAIASAVVESKPNKADAARMNQYVHTVQTLAMMLDNNTEGFDIPTFLDACGALDA